MSSPRSLRSPRAATPAEKRPFVFLYKIDFPNDDPKRVRLPKDFADLLRLATDTFGLRRPAVHLSDPERRPISEISQIEPNMKLYVSSVPPPPPDLVETVFKTRLPRDHTAKQPTLVRQPKPKPPPENAVQHQAIAESRLTVKENLRDSMLSLYASLSPANKAQLGSPSALEKLANDTQHFALEDSLLCQFIGPSSVVTQTPLGERTIAFALDQLKGLRPEECRFVVLGPTQSGKSTLLSMLVSLFNQKVRIASDGRYLIVPFNWFFYQLYLGDTAKLYDIVISNTLDAIRGSNPEVIPFAGILSQWFLSLLRIAALPPLVLPRSKRPDPPWLKAVLEIGRVLYRYWNKKDTSWSDVSVGKPKVLEDDNFSKFLFELFNFPARMAAAFEFKAAVIVYDHLDAAACFIEPGEHFPASHEPVPLLSVLCEAIRRTPFFIASRDDGLLLELFGRFGVDDCRQVSTERIIDATVDKAIVIPQLPGLTVTYDMCRGCPAYCAMYEHVCELVALAQERAAVKSPFARVRSVVDIARNETLRQEFIKLSLLLASADTDGTFDEETMNQLISSPEFTLRVR
jgi:hypothetical protein